MPEEITGEVCTHACSMGCGRKYDAILIQVVDSSTLFLCMPDLMALSRQIMQAMIDPDDPDVQAVMTGASFEDVTYVDSGVDYPYAERAPAPAPEDEFVFDGMTDG